MVVSSRQGSAALLHKIRDRQAEFAVVGLGVAGLPQAQAFRRAGFRVVGIDIDAKVVASLAPRGNGAARAGEPALSHVSTDFDELAQADAVIVCVPTGTTPGGDPDLSAVARAAEEVAPRLRRGMLVILESTVPPGTTRQLVLPALEASGLRAGEDFHLAFSPERIDPGNAKHPVHEIPKIVGGISAQCAELAAAAYAHVAPDVHVVSSPEVAELAKVFENTFRFVNIGLANELALMCNDLGLSPREVIDACATKPFAFMAHYPGPGVGGRCIPMAPQYLAWAASRTNDRELPITQAAMRVNDARPRQVAGEVQRLLSERGVPHDGATVVLLGVAYKPNHGDTGGSVALTLARELRACGFQVLYHDPHVASVCVDGEELRSQALDQGLLDLADCVVLACPHDRVDYDLVLRHSAVILDPTGRLPADRRQVFSI